MDLEVIDRRSLIGKKLRGATYTVSAIDVSDFLGVVPEPEYAAATSAYVTSLKQSGTPAPPSFAPFVAVLGLLKTFDWQDDFLFNYQTGTAMFGEQKIEFHAPLIVEESVVINASVTDVYEKCGKRRFDVIEVSFVIESESERSPIMSGQQSYILFK